MIEQIDVKGAVKDAKEKDDAAADADALITDADGADDEKLKGASGTDEVGLEAAVELGVEVGVVSELNTNAGYTTVSRYQRALTPHKHAKERY